MIGGDYNLVLDVEIDRKGGLAKTHKSRGYKKLFWWLWFSDRCLESPKPWITTLHMEAKKSRNTLQTFFLVSQCIVSNAINADIVPGYKTYHSTITLQLSLHNNLRGQGFWKLNISSLRDEEYVNQIRAAITTITRTKDEYSQVR